MHIIVEFCTSNMLKGTDVTYKELLLRPDIDVLDYGCLSDCGLCSNTHFALVNGKRVSARTPERLLEKIQKKIEELENSEDDFFII